MDKMYKFYVHLPTGKHFLSKEEVLCYANKGKIPTSFMHILCDTSADDNILAQIEFNPDGLPDGWVKEMIFRKCNDGIRKDPPQSMLKRLKVEGKAKQKTMRGLVLDKELPNGQTSNPFEGGTPTGLPSQSDPEGNQIRTVKATGEKEINSETIKRPRGRPEKILKQTNESTSDCDRSSDKETNNIEVKEEVDIGDGEGKPKEKTLEKNMVIQKMDSDNNLTERNLSTRKGDKHDLVSEPDLHKQEKGKLTEAGEKATCSSVHKFYMRRSSNRTLGSKKG